MDSVPETGRASVGSYDDPGFSVVNIAQYRAPLLARIAADVKLVKEALGDDYQVTITGLEEPIRWRVTGPMSLAIYFPYMSTASPARH